MYVWPTGSNGFRFLLCIFLQRTWACSSGTAWCFQYFQSLSIRAIIIFANDLLDRKMEFWLDWKLVWVHFSPLPAPLEVCNFDGFLWEMLLLPALKCCFPSENFVNALLQKRRTCPMQKAYFAISWIDPSLAKTKLFSCFLFHWLLSWAF